MRCDNCKEIEEIDKVPPDCIKQEGGCRTKIDSLGLTEQLVLMAYNDIMKAGNILGADTIIKRHKLSHRDIDLVIALIDERAQIEREKEESGNNKTRKP